MVWDFETGTATAVISGLANATAVITPHGGTPVSVDGVFDRAYVESAGMTGERPTFTALTGELDCVDSRASLVVGERFYRVAIVQPDGMGLTLLVLEDQR